MQSAAPQQATSTQATIKTFPCGSCGARLAFAPGTKTLKCEYCGAANNIPASAEQIEELDFEVYLQALAGKQEKFEQVQVKCDNCGAEQTLPDNIFAGNCTFCATPVVAKGYANRLVKPKALIPFRIAKTKAQDEFRKWIRSLWLAPSELKKYAQGDGGLKGMYVPYWTYDCAANSEYQGERGIDHTTTRRGSDGKSYSETRTDWSSVSGVVENRFDDVLVPASPTMTTLGTSWFSERTNAILCIHLASLGRCSLNLSPGTLVSFSLNSPPLACPGFISNVSVCVGPPVIHSSTQCRRFLELA